MSVSINSPIAIYFFLEPWENRLFGPIDKVTIIIDSHTITLTLTVPTGDFDHSNGTREFFQSWVNHIQGPEMSATSITEEERELLLHFALGYRAFYAERTDIPESAYYEFVGELVAETLALRQPESVAHALETLVEWLLGALPADVFDNPDVEVPPITFHASEDMTELPANALPAVSPTSALIEMCAFLVPALTTYGAHTPANISAHGQSVIMVPPSSVTPEREFVVLPIRPQTECGYTSDDSMPSLRYVSDSSDKD